MVLGSLTSRQLVKCTAGTGPFRKFRSSRVPDQNGVSQA